MVIGHCLLTQEVPPPGQPVASSRHPMLQTPRGPSVRRISAPEPKWHRTPPTAPATHPSYPKWRAFAHPGAVQVPLDCATIRLPSALSATATSARVTMRTIAVICCDLLAKHLLAAGRLGAGKAPPGQVLFLHRSPGFGGVAARALGQAGSDPGLDHARAARELAIHYASTTGMGISSVQVNDRPAVKANFRSTGAWSAYRTDAVVDMGILAGADLKFFS